MLAGATVAAVAIGLGGFWLGKGAGGPQPVDAKGAAQLPAGKGSAAPSGPSGISVEVAKVTTQKLAKSITAVGSLRSDESIVVRPEVAGRIAEILFREGQRVERGATLIKIDASVQRAELEQAKANLSLNQSKLDRALDLQKKGFISSQAREEAENNFRVAQAAFDLASARLTKLDIKAPFSGLVGLRLVSVGDYVKDGQDIVNLEEVDPLKVDFKVPEIYLKQVAVGQSLQINLDAFPDQIYPGNVYAINPLVDANGRSIVIRATVKNPRAVLRPGMFARVRLLLNEDRDSLVVPEQALIPVGDDKFVYKVVDSRALRVKVEVGQRRDGKAEIIQGLAASDVIVTAGQTKVRDGVAVRVAGSGTSSPKSERTAEREPVVSPVGTKAGEKS